MSKRQKTKNQIIASILTITLLSSGTFAWQSFSQLATNEIIGVIDTPGARLHDYFDGTNKDVFVENYAIGDNAPDVYARIKLNEYFEYGTRAGTADAPNPTVVRGDIQNLSEPQIGNVETWDVYSLGASAIDGVESIRTYRELVTGGEGIYLPTYNLDNESLQAEVNGTFAGVDGDGRENIESRYNDYVLFQEGQAYDIDKQETTDAQAHVAASTPFATCMTMSDWELQNDEDKIGDYWVFDTTGWAYYAMPISSSSTTGLLLNEVSVVSNPSDEWYYAVEVTAQLATFGDWGEQSEDDSNGGTGMYGNMTEASEAFLKYVSSFDVWLMSEYVTEYVIQDFRIIGLSEEEAQQGTVQMAVGEKLELSVEVIADDNTKPDIIQGVDWDISMISKTSDDVNLETTFINGIFTPVEGMEENSYILTAQSQYDSTVSSSIIVEVVEQDIYAVLNLDTRYTYSVLESEAKKEMYRQLALGLYNMDETIYITADGYSMDMLSDLKLAVASDFPEIIWVSGRYEKYADRVEMVYEMTKEEVVTMQAEIDAAENLYLETLTNDMTDYEKILHTARYICENVEYVMEGYHQTIYGAMVAQESVCAGYARMFQYLMLRQGIECAYITGVAYTGGDTEDHGWNLVKIDEEYYYVDVTWGDGYGEEDRYAYYYLVQSYDNMKHTHVDEAIYNIPYSQFGTKYIYHTYYNIHYSEYDRTVVKSAWADMYQSGVRQFDLRFTNDEEYVAAFTDLYSNMEAINLIQDISGNTVTKFGGAISNTYRTLTFFVTYSNNKIFSINVVKPIGELFKSRFE